MVLIDERRQRREDDQDIQDLLEVYRALRRLGKWAIVIVGFLVAVVSLILGLKEVFKK